MKNVNKTQNELNSEIVKEYGLKAGANLVGIADSKNFSLAPEGYKPSDNLEGCRSVIVLGVSFPKEVLKNTVEYTECRNSMLTKMTEMAKVVAKQIAAAGYKAKAISASGGKWVNGNQFGFISLKHAAELAGLGIVTRNYLLTNSEYGNLLWFSAVLTDAELIPDKKAKYSFCNKCSKCIEACPSGALNNPSVFGKKECSKFYTIENKKFLIKCAICREVCPYGFGKKDKKYKNG